MSDFKCQPQNHTLFTEILPGTIQLFGNWLTTQLCSSGQPVIGFLFYIITWKGRTLPRKNTVGYPGL